MPRKGICPRWGLWILLLATAVACGVFLALPASALEPPELTGEETVYLYNFDYDTELYHSDFTDENGEDLAVFPASTVKLMAGLLACESLAERFDETLTVTATMLNGVSGNNMGLKVGETVKVKDMIYGLLTNCANDAAQVLAVTVGGSVDGFVSLMNQKARELGMYHTNYTNPTGMHDAKMTTTLRDLAALCKAAYQNEQLLAAASEVKYVMEKTNLTEFRNLYNRNYLLSTFYNVTKTDYRYTGIHGLNAGYTVQGGYCVVTTATRGGLTYLCIVMGGKEIPGETEETTEGITSYEVAETLLDWAFASYTRVKVLSSAQLIGEIPVSLSLAVDHVTLCPALSGDREEIFWYLPSETDVDKEITYSWYAYEKELQAPVAKGTKIGAVTVLYDGEVLCSADLVTREDVERSDLLYMLSRIRGFTKTKFFWATVISAVLLSVLYIVMQAGREERAVRRKHTAGTAINMTMGRPRPRRASPRRSVPPDNFRPPRPNQPTRPNRPNQQNQPPRRPPVDPSHRR